MSDSANAGSPSEASNTSKTPSASTSVLGIGASATHDGNDAPTSCPARVTVTDVSTITVHVPVAAGSTGQCPPDQTQLQTSVLTTTLSCPASVESNFTTPSGRTYNCSKETSTGILAGAAIGSAVGAALLAVLVTALLCRRNRGSSRGTTTTYTSKDFEPHAMTGSRKTGVSMLDTPTPERSSLLVSHLPQPADDDNLRIAVKTLFNQIELHVDNYYSRTDKDMDADIISRLTSMGSMKLPRPLDQMLADSKVVNATLKHCICRILISMSVPNAGHAATLLPSRLAVLPPRMRLASNDSREDLVLHEAYSQWKSLNAFLFPNARDGAKYQNDQELAENNSADMLGSMLAPWEIEYANKASMQQNIRGIVKTAASLGLIIVSQPSAYEFCWDTSGLPSTLVIFPAFLKTSDEHGRQLRAAQVLVPQKET